MDGARLVEGHGKDAETARRRTVEAQQGLVAGDVHLEVDGGASGLQAECGDQVTLADPPLDEQVAEETAVAPLVAERLLEDVAPDGATLEEDVAKEAALGGARAAPATAPQVLHP
jgi:hypothetical protein